MKSRKSYERWVTTLQRASLQRRKLDTRTGGSASLRWPTARAEDAESCGNHPGNCDSLTGAARQWQTPAVDSFRSRGGERKAEMGLDQQARFWYTPNAAMADRGAQDPSTARAQGHANRLQDQAKFWKTPHGLSGHDHKGKVAGGGGEFAKQVMQWPTPVANDHKSSVTGNIKKRNARPLREVVSSFHRARQITPPGRKCSSSGRKLNQRFVAVLMGLPMDWTSTKPLEWTLYEHWAMECTRLLRHLRCALSETFTTEAAA
jgi:DNA (cytosine-5)-methyltransferase 1